MDTTTQVMDLSEHLDLRSVYGELVDAFDADAVRADLVAAYAAAAGDGIHITSSGVVYADLDQVDRAREIQWDDLLDEAQLTAIAQRHNQTTTTE